MEELSFMEGLFSFLLENSTKISAVVTLGTTAGYLALKGYRKARAKIQPYFEVVDKISSLSAVVEDIRKELRYNSGHSFRDEVGDIRKTLRRNTEITELILSRQRWLMDMQSEPVFEADSEGNFTWANSKFIRLTKRTIGELLGNKWRNIIEEDHREQILAEWDEAVQQKRNFERTIHLSDKSGAQFMAQCVAVQQDDETYIGTLTNIEKLVDKHGF